MRPVPLAAVATLLLYCSSDPAEPIRTVDDGLVRYVVSANVADAEITEFLGPHYAYVDFRVATAPPERNRLLVFLPGSNRGPGEMQRFLAHAARSGLHVVGLQYNNSPSLKRLCPDGDPGCFDRARGEIIYGDGPRIDPTHSIENRLTSLLAWLTATHPEEGWGQFLAGGSPRWERVVLVGHSQGGSHAGRIARDHVVDRAILLGNSPSWIDDDHETPIGSYYGFFHWGDHAEERLPAFERFGMLARGPPVNVDDHAPPYGGSRVLFSTLPTEKPHSAVVADAWSPEGPDGKPLFVPVWRYLFGVAP